MTAKYDLHSHSTASDGTLTADELVKRAHQQGVTVLALTDHDTVAGLSLAQQTASQLGIRLINGIELSATYQNQCLHIVGLNITPNNTVLLTGLAQQQSVRRERAKKIADKLQKKTQADVYDIVSQAAGEGEITRSHFAEFLLNYGYVNSQQEAFDRYLSKGKTAYVPTIWASLEETIGWIKSAGGIAVLAHPLRYKLSYKWMNKALSQFVSLGGQGIEVVTGRANPDDIRLSLQMAIQHDLYASVGSDFHNPDNEYVELGRLTALPVASKPVWTLFDNQPSA